MLFRSLSGRFLALTIIFVMIAEVLIFVPSVARFRFDYLQERLERAQIASLALLATPDDMVAPELEAELLANAEVDSIVLRRDAVRELVLMAETSRPVATTYDLRTANTVDLIWDALVCAFTAWDRDIRVIGEPINAGGVAIEATLPEEPLRQAMLDYGLRVLILSAVISVITAGLLMWAVNRFIGRPIARVIDSMSAFQDNPDNAALIIEPREKIRELSEAEHALQQMQKGLRANLQQREHLAALGAAVAKISHDLRNMLTTAQLLADMLERSEDPGVKRRAPKLVASLNRAVNLCEGTLNYGKAEEPSPEKRVIALRDLVADVLEGEVLACRDGDIFLLNEVPASERVWADPEQLHRVLSNLVRNARQAMEAAARQGSIRIQVEMGDILVTDEGPGLPEKALEHLFKPFKGGARSGGTGLGLAIGQELIRAHGGTLELCDTSTRGTRFRITLPKVDPKKLGKTGDLLLPTPMAGVR